MKFHTGGWLRVRRHYLLSPKARLPELDRLVDEGGDLEVNGARGVGKTTLARMLAAQLNESGRYAALIVPCRPWASPEAAFAGIRRRLFWEGLRLPADRGPHWRSPGGESGLRRFLSHWSMRSRVRTALLLDDFDLLPEPGRLAMLEDALGLGLGEDAPLHLLVLLGARSFSSDCDQIRRSRARSGFLVSEDRVRSLALEPFSLPQVQNLLEMHTATTNQAFEPRAILAVHSLTRGEPGRVNSLAAKVVKRVPRQRAVIKTDVQQAFDLLWPRKTQIEHRSSPSTRIASRKSGWRPAPSPSTSETALPVSEDRREPTRPSLWKRLATAVVVIFAIAVILILWQRYRTPAPLPPRASDVPKPKDSREQIAAISSPEEFEDLCSNMVSDKEIFDACRQKLPVFELSYRWLDTKLLVKPDETLSLDHLGLFYGLEGTEAEAARHAIGAVLAGECRRGRQTGPATFEQLMDPQCKQALPTLTQIGLELDREWMGVRSIDSDYANVKEKSH